MVHINGQKITFHTHDLKRIGGYIGAYKDAKIMTLPYDDEDGELAYAEDTPIKTCFIQHVGRIEGDKDFVYILLEDQLFHEETGELEYNVCLVVPEDKFNDFIKPIDEVLRLHEQ